MKIVLKRLLDQFDKISERHEEIHDAEVRELLYEAIYHGFIVRTPDYSLPNTFGMFERTGNTSVRSALSKFVQQALELDLGAPADRFAAFQDASVTSKAGTSYDDYFGNVESFAELVRVMSEPRTKAPAPAKADAPLPPPTHTPLPAPREGKGKRVEIALVALRVLDATTYSKYLVALKALADKHDGITRRCLHVALIEFQIGSESDFAGSEAGIGFMAPDPEACCKFASEVQAQFGDLAAIVHGIVTVYHGCFGSEKCNEWGVWWPGAVDAFRQVATLPPGQVCKLTLTNP
jgi:hypothetical protein